MTPLEAIAERGFAVVPLADPGLVAELRAACAAHAPEAERPFFASSNDLDPEAAAVADAALRALLAGPLAAALPGLVPFLASSLVKGAGGDGRIDLHQDLTYTDERRHRTVLAWVPLVDVDERRGALRVVPGSHRWSQGTIRPGGERQLATEHLQDRFDPLAELVPVPAGTAVVYDTGLVHGSPPNQGPGPRPAVGVLLAPAGAPLVHVHQEADGALAAYAVDADFYARQSLWRRPVGYDRIPAWGRAIGPADLAAHLGAP